MKLDTQRYLDYLDKEMTIMGILSAVSIAAPAGILNAMMGESGPLKTGLWAAGRYFILTGSVLCVAAAFFFYKERSLLAWFYGQICLEETLGDGPSIDAEIRELLRAADSWESWWAYSWGFTSLVAGFVTYTLGAFFYLASPYLPYLGNHLRSTKLVALCLCFLIAVITATLQRFILTHDDYKFSEEPWTDFRQDIERTFHRKLPHDDVYTRLAPSPISGVGVFAIRDIPKGKPIFKPDDDDLVPVKRRLTKGLEKAVVRLYEDFCVLKGDTYQCPVNFNKITPSWFLNGSKNPNVAADLSLKFYALADIKAGDELTVDYAAYGDNELAKVDSGT
jgi:hypothetical protein